MRSPSAIYTGGEVNQNLNYMCDTNSLYTQWEIDVTHEICQQLGCTYSDASGFLDTHSFYLSQAWGMDLNPKNTANHIINKTKNNA